VIAVDIDEVLAHHNRGLARFHNAHYGTDHTEHDYVSDYWGIIWRVDSAEAERRAMRFHDERWHRRFEPIAGARESLDVLATRHRLVVVTVRRRSIVDDTHDWLDEFFPGIFADVRFVGHWEGPTGSKAAVCREIGATHLIDDSLSHCTRAGAAGVTALLFGEYPWNAADSLPPGVVRVRDWPAVLSYFEGPGH
jgi:5'(3')-deoxyribonucleotidase